MIVAVIPTRYEPDRLRALVDAIRGDVDILLVLDNGHEPRLRTTNRYRVVDTRGMGIYQQWNEGWRIAREWADGQPFDLAFLNDDVEMDPHTLSVMAGLLRAGPAVVVHPARDEPRGVRRPALVTSRDPDGPYDMTGYCFMVRGEMPLPAFDEGFGWWCGDTAFERGVRRLGHGIGRIDGLGVDHQSDSERDNWARRPELRDVVEQDKSRWERMLAQPNVAFLVPRRRDGGHRDALWEWAKARWAREFPGIPVVEGHHEEGPFSRSAAINTAARMAGDWDFGIVIDSDVFVRTSQLRQAIDRAQDTGRVTWAHRRWRGLSEEATERVVADRHDFGPALDHDDMDLLVERTNPLSWSCCVVIPRPVWDDMGGFDERFRGWGFEDMAFMSVVCGLYGHERIEGDIYHLWHPRSDERIHKGQDRTTATPEYVVNARLGRRYMVALRRDHRLHDRPGLPSSDEERERDIANLKRDDAKYEPIAKRHRLPDWSEWWPTLEELRAGAKAHSPEPAGSVTVAVTSGGPSEVWAERREYLRQSLASLTAQVTGPIVQRIVFSDWPTAVHADVERIAEPFGFYVVGGGHHGYTEMRQRFFRYLARRAQGAFVFAVEDDFLYDRPVDLGPMIETLVSNPELRQLALLRGPAFPREFEAGGVLESLATPIELVNHRAFPFVRHRDHFTCNPSLFRRELADKGWPAGESSERAFGNRILADRRAAFAYWGSGEPWISHIGTVRASPTGAY